MTSTDSPVRAAARASAAVTVVLPTPPFPATMTTRDAAKNCAGSTLFPSEEREPHTTDPAPWAGHRRARADGSRAGGRAPRRRPLDLRIGRGRDADRGRPAGRHHARAGLARRLGDLDLHERLR